MSISISAVFSATTGVAPMYLHCDGAGTTSTATSRPFHEIRYIWSILDYPDEYYTTGSTPMLKRVAYGPIAGFCLEYEGTYTAELAVFDGTSFSTTTQNITVTSQDDAYPTTSTICFSATGSAAGAPAGATIVTTSSWDTIITYLATGKRLLLNRGEVFSVAAEWNEVNYVDGPWVVGAYGSGAKPIVRPNNGVTFVNSGILQVGAHTHQVGNGMVVQDVVFDGINIGGGTPVWYRGRVDDLTLFRVDAINSGSMITYVGQWRLGTDHAPRRIGMFECTNTSPMGTAYFAALYGDYMCVRGCYGNQDGGGTHSLRIFGAYKSHIANNTLISGDNGRQSLKIHGTSWATTVFTATTGTGTDTMNISAVTSGVVEVGMTLTGGTLGGTRTIASFGTFDGTSGTVVLSGTDTWANPTTVTGQIPYSHNVQSDSYGNGTSDGGGYTKYNVINFNYFGQNATGVMPVSVGPEDPLNDERVHENIIECNYIPAPTGSILQYGFHTAGSYNTFRNNVIDLTQSGANNCYGFYLLKESISDPTGNEFYNNTVRAVGALETFTIVRIGVNCVNNTVKNNLTYAPTANGVTIVDDNGTGTVTGNNTSNAATDPVFASATPSTLKDFILANTSPYLGSGASLKGFYDALGNSRGIQGEAHDAGALCAKNKQHRFIPA